MAVTPVIRHRGAVLASGALCPRCGDKGHIMSDHDETKTLQCSRCACVAQDTRGTDGK